MSTLNSLAVVLSDVGDESYIHALASALKLPALPSGTSPKWVQDYLYVLLRDDNGLCLVKTGKSAPAPVRVDFCSGAVAHRRKYGGGKGQDIAKAVGLNKRSTLSVLDATAGLGRDSFVLATLGATVTMMERVPFVRQLLQDGLLRGLDNEEVAPVLHRMMLIDETLTTLSGANSRWDVVYLDPMFPHQEKSAAVKKEMQFFRDLVGFDQDSDSLLEPALKAARYRVVVKRPKGAPYLAGKEATYQLSGKSGRFDVYVNRSLDLND